jgi:hypothetical protein
METMILVGILALVVGVVAGRLSLRSSRSNQGGQFTYRGVVVQVPHWVLVAVLALMTSDEKDTTVLVGQLRDRGIDPTPAQLQAAAQAFERAFTQWLATAIGQEWAARHAPHLLGD